MCDSKAVDGRRKDPWIGQVHNSTFVKRKWRFMSGDVETEEVNNDAKLPLSYTAVQTWLVSTRDLGKERESSNHPNVAQSLIPMSNPLKHAGDTHVNFFHKQSIPGSNSHPTLR